MHSGSAAQIMERGALFTGGIRRRVSGDAVGVFFIFLFVLFFGIEKNARDSGRRCLIVQCGCVLFRAGSFLVLSRGELFLPPWSMVTHTLQGFLDRRSRQD